MLVEHLGTPGPYKILGHVRPKLFGFKLVNETNFATSWSPRTLYDTKAPEPYAIFKGCQGRCTFFSHLGTPEPYKILGHVRPKLF